MSDRNDETRRTGKEKEQGEVKDLPDRKTDAADAEQVKGGRMPNEYLKK